MPLMSDHLYVTKSGANPATPLVLLHGFPIDGRIWADAVRALGDRRVAVVDLPGFGMSSNIVATTMEQFGIALHDTLNTNNLLPCVLGGLSMGGYIAQDFLRRYRGDVRGLLLVDTKSAADDPAQKAGRDAMIELVRAGGAAAVAEQMLPKVLGPTSHRDRPDVVRRVREMMTSQSAAGIESALVAMRDRPDYTSDLEKIDVPTLIVVGDEDQIAPASIATGMGSRVAGSHVIAISGAGHFPPIETPEAFAEAASGWLAINSL
jgi:pimeloyl-ACP methyl ester carboxylesterase